MSYEKFPRFDAITEFMNIALIPIGFILLIAMFMLAYWSNNFRYFYFIIFYINEF